jgi:ribonuclease BN (tRNA processing enzyme)
MNDASSRANQAVHHPASSSVAPPSRGQAGPARLLVLGTQGWIPTPRRETTSLAFLWKGTLLIFDAGTGLSRFLQPPASHYLAAADQIHLLLTHYHLDHSAGVSFVTGLFEGREVTIHVPDADLNGVPPEDGLPQLIRSPFFPAPLAEQKGVTLTSLSAGDNDVGGIRVRARAQCHADTTAGYRVEDLFVLATDTVADEGTAEFAQGAQVLLHEAWIEGGETDEREHPELIRATMGSHTSARQAASLAASAGVGQLYLIHLNPLLGEDYYEAMGRSAREVFPATTISHDLLEHVFAATDAAPASSGRVPD